MKQIMTATTRATATTIPALAPLDKPVGGCDDVDCVVECSVDCGDLFAVDIVVEVARVVELEDVDEGTPPFAWRAQVLVRTLFCGEVTLKLPL